MAQAPSKEHVSRLRKQSRDADSKKRRIQKKQNKGFVNHGQGVMPERVWQDLPGKTAESAEVTQ